jgi:hypothetical protein
MRKISSLAILAVVAGLLSFSNGNVISKPQANAGKMVKPPAAVTTNVIVPLSLDVFIPCAADGAGEMVHLEGDLHVLITFNINGNNVNGQSHFQPQGVSGTGLTTGDRYQATGITRDDFKGSLQNNQYKATFVNNFRIIGQGPGNNFLAHATTHIAINANGDVTAEVENVTDDCQ